MCHAVDNDCLRELRWLYDRRDLAEARRDLGACFISLAGSLDEVITEVLRRKTRLLAKLID